MFKIKTLFGWTGLLLTIGKFLFCWLITISLVNKENGWASLFITAYIVSDIFDGVIFRKSSNEFQKNLGFTRRVIDAVGDRIAIYIVFAALIKKTAFPSYIYILEIAREICLISIISYSYISKRPIKEPNLESRTATLAAGIAVIAWLNSLTIAVTVLICVMVSFGAVGIWKYILKIRHYEIAACKK